MSSECTSPKNRVRETLAGSKIFFVANATEVDAPTRLLLEVAKGAKQTGMECSFLAWSRLGPLEPFATELFGHRPEVLRERAGVGDLGAMWKLKYRVATEKPSLVHAILTRPGIFVPPAVQMSKVRPRVVITQHGVHEWAEGGFPEYLVQCAFRLGAAFADSIVTVSRAVGRDLAAIFPSLSDRIYTIYNGVDTERFHPNGARSREELIARFFPTANSRSAFLVGAAGNLRPVKGYDVLVEAAAQLRHRGNFLFVVWGEGPERARLEKAIESQGLRDRFVLAGYGNNLPQCLVSCDCFVQPSRYESFGLAAAEAMACGVPVIASNVGGLPELLEDGRTGFLVPPDDPNAIARHLEFLAERSDLRQVMGVQAAQRIRQHFTIERMVREYLQLYSQLLQKS